METFLTKEMVPVFPVPGNIDINFSSIENQGSAGCICTKRTTIRKHSYIFCLLIFLCNPEQLNATMGLVVLTQDSVVIGIDSQISGPRARLSCKLRHNSTTAIIASGTYNFSIDLGQYQFFDQADQILRKPTLVQDTAIALDDKLEPLLKSGLSYLYTLQPRYYVGRYGVGKTVMEFAVAGLDKSGPSVSKNRYFAITPRDFRPDPARFVPVAKAVVVVPVPSVDIRKIVTRGDFWKITAKPGKAVEAQIAAQIVYFINAAKTQGPTSISDPVVTAVIDKDGFRFLNSGKCGNQ